MNDKQQLAAMGEHLAEQQPMCLQKRVERLEALLREVRDMMDNQPRGFSGMIRRIDNELGCVTTAQQAVPEGWKLVPVEPDYSMLSADGCKEHAEGKNCVHHDNRRRIWAAMLAAAPSPDSDK